MGNKYFHKILLDGNLCLANKRGYVYMSNELKTPFRYDYVGSFLRPQALKDAKAQLRKNEISKEDYDKIVDEEVAKLVAKQKELGYHVITDGEFRRAFWHLDFMWGFEGVEHENTGGGIQFHGELALLDDTYLVGKLKAKPHPFVEYFKFLKQFEDENTVAKYTIPAPAQTFQQFIIPDNLESTRKFYETNEELIHTLDEVMNIQKELVITSHICRGNYNSTYFSSGAYDSVADYVFARENVDALLLEYDDERSGSFEALAKVSPDKKVVLGLITTKSPKLEDKEAVIARIKEASKYVPLERLCLSPQCGFASCEIGNKLTEEEQWAKLRLVKEIAEEVWG